MARVSRFKLEEKVLDKIFNLFFEIVGKRRRQSEFMNVMQDVLSPNERVMIAKRIAIMYLLNKNIPVQTICNVVKVSPNTVFKFVFLLDKTDGITPILRRVLQHESIADFFEEILIDLHGPGTPYTNWSVGWQRKNEFERKKARGI